MHAPPHALILAPDPPNPGHGAWVTAVRLFEGTILEETRQLLEEPPEFDSTPAEYLAQLENNLRLAAASPLHIDAAANILEKFRTFFIQLTQTDSASILHDYIDRTFRFAVDSYRAAGASVPKEIENSLSVKIVPMDSKPIGTIDLDYYMSAAVEPGCTHSPSGPGCTHWQSLVLKIVPKQFDSLTHGAIPFALFHEIVCHALQAPYNAMRPVPSPFSHFAEGFMDRSAWEVFSSSLSSYSSEDATCIFSPPNDPGFYLKMGGDLYRARHAEPSDSVRGSLKKQTIQARRYYGWKTACRLKEELERLQAHAPIELVTRLSLQLNADAAFSPAERDEFVTRLAYWLNGAGDDVISVESIKPRQLLRRYIEDGHVNRLVGAVLALDSSKILG